MHNCYRDILDRIAEPVSWFDDRGVPRFSQFTPGQLGNIHAKEAALAEVSCQGCGRIFKVAITDAFTDRGLSLSDAIRLRRASYYDPPNVECCDVGPAMRSVTRMVLEYWSRDIEIDFDWRRDPLLEGPCEEEWFDPPDTISDIKAALDVGATKMLVLCTSDQNRYDLAGRTAVALVSGLATAGVGRLHIIYPDSYLVMAGKMLEGHAPAADIGPFKESRRIALVDFERARGAAFEPHDAFLILSGPTLRAYPEGLPPRIAAREDIWAATARRLADEFGCCRQIEFTLAHSRPMLSHPDAVIDASRSSAPLA